MKKSLLLLGLFALAAVLLTACNAAQEAEDPTAAFCADLEQLATTGPLVDTLAGDADIAQIVQLSTAFLNDWQSVSSSVERLDDAEVQAAFAKYDEMFTSVPAVTQETAVPVARQTLDTLNNIATQAYEELYPMACSGS